MASSKLSKFVVAVDNTDIKTEEGKLWKSVISMAAYDAVKKTEYDVYASREILEARNWFRHKSWDFHYVCNLAGMNPEYVHFKMMKQINKIEKGMKKWSEKSAPDASVTAT
tara:strand:- start:2326 stop:2658 length:333 start_codon:yes stop_codon:yes gene_type:complete